MSLTIKISTIYYNLDEPDRERSNGDDETITNESESEKRGSQLPLRSLYLSDCKYRVYYGNSKNNFNLKLGTINSSFSFRSLKKSSNTNKKSRKKKKANGATATNAPIATIVKANTTLGDGDDDSGGGDKIKMSDLANSLSDTSVPDDFMTSILNDKKLIYYFKDESLLNLGDYLEIFCYKSHKRTLRPFGKYKMLLDLLILNQDEFNTQSKLSIDDFLVDPKTNATLKERIVFDLVYETEINDRKNAPTEFYRDASARHSTVNILQLSPPSYETSRSMNVFNSLNYQPTAIDFIRIIIRTGQFAISHFCLEDNDDLNKVSVRTINLNDEMVKNFIWDVGFCTSTLNLALNLLVSYELSYEQKEEFKKTLIKFNPYDDPYEELNEINLHNLIDQIFNPIDLNEEKITSWQVRVRIIELKHIAGINETVYCVIEIGDQKFRSKEKSIDNLNYSNDDQVFITRIETKQFQKAFNYKIVIAVYFKNFFYADRLVGKFQTDFATIYRQPGHEVYHKWGEILAKNDKSVRKKSHDMDTNHVETDLNDVSMSEMSYNASATEFLVKGYVKFDIILQSKGDKVKIHYEQNKNDDSDDIETNLLYPYGLNNSRQFVRVSVHINKAQILVKSENNIFEQFRSSIFNVNQWLNSNDQAEDENESELEIIIDKNLNPNDVQSRKIRSILNPFVKVSYAGLTKRTPVLKQTSKPEWNFSIDFNVRYPPLVRLIKIELCHEEGSNEVTLAREFITLSDISNYRNDYPYLPSFGPRFIDLYNEPKNLRIRKNFSDQENALEYMQQAVVAEDQQTTTTTTTSSFAASTSTSNNSHFGYTPLTAVGSHYVARLLFSITSRKITPNFDSKKYLTMRPSQANNLYSKLKKAEFVAYVVINEVTMIDSQFQGQNLNFKLSVGINGHENDANKMFNKTEMVRAIQLNAEMPLYLPYEKTKPCICLSFVLEDTRAIMFKTNYIQNSLDELIKLYLRVKNVIWDKLNEPILNDSMYKKATNVYQQIRSLAQEVKSYLLNEYLKNDFITDFDRYRVKLINTQFSIIVDLLNLLFKLICKFRLSASNESFKFYIDLIIQNSMAKIRNYLKEPFSYFPDLNLWLMANETNAIGVCNIRSEDVIWSPVAKKRGSICAKMIYTDVKSLNSADFDNPERENIARIRIFSWIRSIHDCNLTSNERNLEREEFLPSGFQLSKSYMNEFQLPTKLFYTDRFTFQLNAYLYQGRDMLLLDIAGESDPFAKITIGNQSVTSNTIDNTVNPTWNQALCIPQVYLYGTLDAILNDPPEIVVEIYDEDPFNQKEFMGRFFVKPVINKTITNPPKLRWHKLYHTYEPSGDILASFELILINDDNDENNSANSYMRNQIKMSSTSLLNSFNLNLSKRIMPPVSIPDIIKPRTRPYTLEISYWGLRNLKDQGFISIGQQKLSVQIEIGDKSLEPNIMDKCPTNGNFAVTHRKYEIDLAEEDDYKPHLNIRCECYGSLFLYSSMHQHLETLEKTFSRKILFGTCTIKSIGDYCCTNEQLAEFCQKHANRNLIHLINISDFNRDSILQQRNKSKQFNVRIGPINTQQSKDNEDDDQLDLDYLDWWSKYFNAINNENENKRMNTHKKKHYVINTNGTETNRSDGENSDIYFSDDMLESNATNSRLGFIKKHKKRKNKKRNAEATKLLKKTSQASSLKTIQRNNAANNSANNDASTKKALERVQIYDRELEKVFKLNETMESFNLIVGKNKPKDDSFQCRFKGKFMLYDENLLTPDLVNYLNVNGGFLKKMPTNVPIKVKIHVYIIKVSIVNPIHFIGKFEPSICLQFGNTEISEKIKNDSVEPLIGKCFEIEARFPNESQLDISIKNWNLLAGGTELIGKTVIDLEDRFYSDCYAACGIPKKFDINGYNMWRDCFMPTQLLAKLCKKYGLRKPQYLNKKLIIHNSTNKIFEYPNLKKTGAYYSDLTDLSSNETDTSVESSGNENLKDANQIAQSNAEMSAPNDTLSTNTNLIMSSNSKDVKINRYHEQLALDALNDWEKITGVSLVPEHVETRSLYNPEAGSELEQGKIQMWIDMFLINDYKMDSLPKPIDVSVRKPKKFQLRVVIFNTKNVILDDTNVVTGERKSDIYVKGFMCDKMHESQQTDVHYRSLNGEGNFNWRFVFDFDYLPAEKKIVYTHRQRFSFMSIERKIDPVLTLQCYDADQFSADDLLGEVRLNLSKLIKSAHLPEKCTMKMIKNKRWPKVNLFRVKKHRGWYPFTSNHPDYVNQITGKVEVELKLMSEKEMNEHPAGLGRNPPDPLPEPQRPETSFLWFTRPLQTFRFIIWKHFWRQILLGFFIFVVVLVFIIFMVQLPNAIIGKIIG